MNNLDDDIKDKIIYLISMQLKRVQCMYNIVKNDHQARSPYIKQESKLWDFMDYVKSDLSK